MSKSKKNEPMKNHQNPDDKSNKIVKQKVLIESDKTLISNLKSLIEQNWKKRESLREKREAEKSALVKQENSLKECKDSLQSTTDKLAEKILEYKKLIKEYPYAVKYDESGKIFAKTQEELVADLNTHIWKQKFLTELVPKFERENELRKKWPPTVPPITFSPVLAHLNLNYYYNTGMRFMFKYFAEKFVLKPSESCFDVYHMIKSSEGNETQEVSAGTVEESKPINDNLNPKYVIPYAYDEKRHSSYARFKVGEWNLEEIDSDWEPADITYTEHSQAEDDNTLMNEANEHSYKESCDEAENGVTRTPNNAHAQNIVEDHVEGKSSRNLQNESYGQSENAGCSKDSVTPSPRQKQNGMKPFSDDSGFVLNSREYKVNSKISKLDMASVTIDPYCVKRDKGQERTLVPASRRNLLDIKGVRKSNSENIVLGKSRSPPIQPKVSVKFKEHRFTYPDGSHSKTNKKLYHSPYASEKKGNENTLKKIGSVIEHERHGVKRKLERSISKERETTLTRVKISTSPSKPINISKLHGHYMSKSVKNESLGKNLENDHPKPKTPNHQNKVTGLSKFVPDDESPVVDEVAINTKKCMCRSTTVCRNAMPVNVIRPFGDNEVSKYIRPRPTIGFRKKKISLDDETTKLTSGIKNKPKVLHNLVCVPVRSPERYRCSEFIAPSSPIRRRARDPFCPRATRSSSEPRKLPMRKQKSLQDIIAQMSSE